MRRIEKKTSLIAIVLFLWAAVFFVLPAMGGGRAYAASARDEARPLTLKKLMEKTPADLGLPSGCTWYLEGGTATPSGYVMSFWSSTMGTNANPVLLLDMNSWQVVKNTQSSLSHANDMCYVPKSQEILVTPMDQNCLFSLNVPALTTGSTFYPYPQQNYHAIGYDTAADRYAAVYEAGSGAARQLHCDILDRTLARTGTFSVATNLTYQGLAVQDSLIYYTCWERGGTSKYEPVYDKVFQKDDNVIYVYNFSGQLVKTLLIPCPQGYSKFELETASFIGNRMILQFNETKDKKNLIGIYEVTAEGKSAALIAAEKEAAEKAAAEKAAAEKTAAEQTAAEQAVSKQMKPARPKFAGITKKKRAVKLKWKKVKVGKRRVSGYEVQICTNRTFTGDTLRTVTVPGVKCTIRGLNRRTVYFVRVRAYQNVGTGKAYSQWSVRKKAKTK